MSDEQVSVRQVRFEGEPAIELETDTLRLVAITERGPRIAHLSPPGGDNLLYWAPGKHTRGAWDALGGHRLWTTRPGADESEETYRPDDAPCRVLTHADGFTLTTPADPTNGVQRGFRVQALSADRLRVEHFLYNTGTLLWSGGLWGVTVTRPAACYSVPLADTSAWNCATVVLFARWGAGQGDGSFSDPQFSFSERELLLEPSGREGKRMIGATVGIVSLQDSASGILFAKRAAYCANALYPRNANLALYTCKHYVELETMSPFMTLAPGETALHTEVWVLRAGCTQTPAAADLSALFS